MNLPNKYQRSGVGYTHVVLRGISARNLKSAEEQAEGRQQACLITNLFAFLTVEAFLNYLGEELIGIEKWRENYARPLSARGKITFIGDHVDLKINWQERPFSTLREMRKFRIAVVHGAPDRLDSSDPFDPSKVGMMETYLDSQCTPDLSKRLFDDAGDICERLYVAAGLCTSGNPWEMWLISYEEQGGGPTSGE